MVNKVCASTSHAPLCLADWVKHSFSISVLWRPGGTICCFSQLILYTSPQEKQTGLAWLTDVVYQGAFTIDLASLFRDAIEREGLDLVVQADTEPPYSLPTYISFVISDPPPGQHLTFACWQSRSLHARRL